jgi:DNA-binding IclR family transcriptional regulator
MKQPPTYAAASVDHALRLAQILQIEGAITVSAAADRLGVARSTAHRILSALVYRDFAVQAEDRSYRVGPILELAGQARSNIGALRAAALGPMRALVDTLDETVNLSIRTGRTVRFIASVESSQVLRVGTREGAVFPAHLVTGGLVMLAALTDDEVAALYAAEPDGAAPDLVKLRRDLRAVRRSGIALNLERSERGVVALGTGIRDGHGATVAALAVSMPSVRYVPGRIEPVIAALTAAAASISRSL